MTSSYVWRNEECLNTCALVPRSNLGLNVNSKTFAQVLIFAACASLVACGPMKAKNDLFGKEAVPHHKTDVADRKAAHVHGQADRSVKRGERRRGADHRGPLADGETNRRDADRGDDRRGPQTRCETGQPACARRPARPRPAFFAATWPRAPDGACRSDFGSAVVEFDRVDRINVLERRNRLGDRPGRDRGRIDRPFRAAARAADLPALGQRRGVEAVSGLTGGAVDDRHLRPGGERLHDGIFGEATSTKTPLYR